MKVKDTILFSSMFCVYIFSDNILDYLLNEDPLEMNWFWFQLVLLLSFAFYNIFAKKYYKLKNCSVFQNELLWSISFILIPCTFSLIVLLIAELCF